jgi:hypothetical protein
MTLENNDANASITQNRLAVLMMSKWQLTWIAPHDIW